MIESLGELGAMLGSYEAIEGMLVQVLSMDPNMNCDNIDSCLKAMFNNPAMEQEMLGSCKAVADADMFASYDESTVCGEGYGALNKYEDEDFTGNFGSPLDSLGQTESDSSAMDMSRMGFRRMLMGMGGMDVFGMMRDMQAGTDEYQDTCLGKYTELFGEMGMGIDP